MKYILISIISILIVAQTSQLSRAQDDTRQSASDRKAEKQHQFVSIDFNNVDINVFIKFMSELSGTNFVVDQRVKGKVTIISPSKISMKEARSQLYPHRRFR
jgi:general secretion pathway protein D